MTTFDDREKGFEARYAHDEELQFKVNARRNKLLGLWAAKLLGKTGAEADTYARDVVMSDFEKPGHDDVLHKLARDLKGAGINKEKICAEADRLLEQARTQIMNES